VNRASRAAGVSYADLMVVALIVAVVAAAAAVGLAVGVQAATPPLYALWRPHIGPGTLPAAAIAVLVIAYGIRLAATLPWRRLLLSAYAVSVLWTLSLALIDGWREGIATRLTTDAEYLSALPAAGDIPTMIRTYAARIADFQPDSWNTQAAGHPPGALLVFAVLDRIGLPGGVPAAFLCILAGCVAAVAAPWTLRSLGDEAAARAAVPFVVLFPGAVWVGVSADGLFLGVTSLAVACLAAGVRRAWLAVLSGVLFGFAAFLSYGMVLMGFLAVAVAVAARRFVPLVWAALGGAAVVGAFAAAGFWWFEGYFAVHSRYYQGIASQRPYWYWVWANLGALAISAGPAGFVAARRAVVARSSPAALLCIGALAAIVVADLSGLSKAEVERIWLPFAIWLPAAAVFLPRRARTLWLGVQVATALVVNHLFHTVW
jgi:methylthioxylose transferase